MSSFSPRTSSSDLRAGTTLGEPKAIACSVTPAVRDADVPTAREAAVAENKISFVDCNVGIGRGRDVAAYDRVDHATGTAEP